MKVRVNQRVAFPLLLLGIDHRNEHDSRNIIVNLDVEQRGRMKPYRRLQAQLGSGRKRV